MQQLTIEHIKQWFGDSLKNAPLELAIVGDFDPEAVIEMARRYFGSLAPRTETRQSALRSLNFPAGESLHLAPDSEIEKALVAVVYPTADFWNIQRTRRLNMLAELLSEELRVHIREKMGAAYSPYAYHHAFRAYSGYGLLQAHLLVDPSQIDMIAAEVKRIAGQMASQGISPDQLRRVLDPTLVQIKDLRQSNTYWLNSVLAGASRHPEQLVWARTMESDYRAISVHEINTLAKQYLDNQKAATIVVVPMENQKEK
jgi:zinc protease